MHAVSSVAGSCRCGGVRAALVSAALPAQAPASSLQASELLAATHSPGACRVLVAHEQDCCRQAGTLTDASEHAHGPPCWPGRPCIAGACRARSRRTPPLWCPRWVLLQACLQAQAPIPQHKGMHQPQGAPPHTWESCWRRQPPPEPPGPRGWMGRCPESAGPGCAGTPF